MGVFSRISDILNANIVHMLDKAEDPEKMVRLMIQEMEDTLIEVKSAAAKIISEKKGIERQIQHYEKEELSWQNKAELAIAKDREDLARGAVFEKIKLQESRVSGATRIVNLEGSLDQLRFDINTLSDKLNDAKERQKSIILKKQALLSQAKIQNTLAKSGAQRVFDKFDLFESNLDRLEGELLAGKLESTKGRALKDELQKLEDEGKIEDELAKIKRQFQHGAL